MLTMKQPKKIIPTYTITDVARMAGVSRQTAFNKVMDGLLPALVYEYDEESEEVVQVVREKEKHAGEQLFIPVDAANYFIQQERAKAKQIGKAKRPPNLSEQDETEILDAAERVLQRSDGYVQRRSVLIEWKNVQRYPDAEAKIKWVLDLDENRVRYPKTPGR